MIRLPLDVDPVLILDPEVRYKFSILRACDCATKIDDLGWRFEHAVWIFEGGYRDDFVNAPELWTKELSDEIDRLRRKPTC